MLFGYFYGVSESIWTQNDKMCAKGRELDADTWQLFEARWGVVVPCLEDTSHQLEVFQI